MQGVDLVSFFSAQVCVVQSAFLGDWLVNKNASYAFLGQLIACCTSYLNPRHTTNRPLTSLHYSRDPPRCPRPQADQVFLEMVMDGNLDEKSLFLAAIDTATLRATAL